MKQKITNAEKLYHLLFEICARKENRKYYRGGAYEVVLSVTLVLKDNSYKDIRDIINPNDIKIFYILNQMTGKKLIFAAKDIKSSSYQHGELRVNRYKTIVDELANMKYKAKTIARLTIEKEINNTEDEDED